MNKRVLKIAGLVGALVLVLGVGAAVGGGIVYAITRDKEPIQAASGGTIEPGPGIVIAAVVSDGPATEAGVVRGDILLEVDGEAVDDFAELVHALEAHDPGDEVQLTIVHGDDERTLPVILGDQEGKPYLGIIPCGGRVGPGSMVSIHVEGPGAMIIEVEPDSPADAAGLEEGDVIVAVDGQELDSKNTLTDAIAAHEPGDTVALQVTKPGEEPREVMVKLGEHPEEEGKAYLGVKYRTVPSSYTLEGAPLPFEGKGLHIQPFLHGLPGTEAKQGAFVRRVTEDSPAEAAGLRSGDLITAIEGEPVEGPQDLAVAIAEHKPGDRVTLTVLQHGEDEERDIEITLAEHPEKEGEAYLGVHIGGFVRVGKAWPDEHLDRREPLQFFDDFDWEAPLDELPLEPEALPDHFRFHFSPGISIEIDEIDCCGDSI